jgi:hypothetical protein
VPAHAYRAGARQYGADDWMRCRRRCDNQHGYASGDSALIKSSDSEYEATKRIKQGKARLAAPFDELAAWISERWSVTVLNVIYDGRNALHPPRIQVILEHEAEAQGFRDGYKLRSQETT